MIYPGGTKNNFQLIDDFHSILAKNKYRYLFEIYKDFYFG